ncbi:MAG: hypothetical protein NXI24_09535 [bacterium]|nr:hypothetical protein [bacterium]
MKILRIRPLTLLLTAALSVMFLPHPGGAYSVAEKAQIKRIELVKYLRHVKPLVYNFPCMPFPECYKVPEGGAKFQEGERVDLFKEIKRVYQEGTIYYFEGNYLNAYNRFLDTQVRIERLLEGMSQFYLDRTEQMLRDSVEKKNPNDPDDMSVVDIQVEYGPQSRKRIDFGNDRDAPLTQRRYAAKEAHWAYNKYRIEKNVEKGYEHLGLAKKARQRALMVDRNLTKNQKITPAQRKKRIEFYLGSIRMAQLAKVNAAFIYQLKYPFDNYALHNVHGFSEKGGFEERTVPKLEDVQMNWTENPYVLPKKLHPAFDLSLPAEYRRDTSDAQGMLYEEEVDIVVRMRYYDDKPESFKQEGGDNGANNGAGNN